MRMGSCLTVSRWAGHERTGWTPSCLGLLHPTPSEMCGLGAGMAGQLGSLNIDPDTGEHALLASARRR